MRQVLFFKKILLIISALAVMTVFCAAEEVSGKITIINDIDIRFNGESAHFIDKENVDKTYTATAEILSTKDIKLVFIIVHAKDGAVEQINYCTEEVSSNVSTPLSVSLTLNGIDNTSELKCFLWKYAAADLLEVETVAAMKMINTKAPFNEITEFKIPALGQYGNGYVMTAHEVDGYDNSLYGFNSDKVLFFVPSSMILQGLTPEITLSADSENAVISPSPGAAVDFSNDVTYTVTAENGSVRSYTVSMKRVAAPSTNYYYEDFEQETPDSGTGEYTKYNVQYDTTTKLPVYTFNSGNKFSLGIQGGSSYLQVAEEDTQDGINKVLKICDPNTASKIRPRFPDGPSSFSGSNLSMVRFKVKLENVTATGGAYFSFGTATRLFLAKDESGQISFLAPLKGQAVLGGSMDDYGVLAEGVSEGEWHEIAVVVKSVGGSNAPESYFFFDGVLSPQCSGAYILPIRTSIIAFFPELVNGSVMDMYIDNILYMGI